MSSQVSDRLRRQTEKIMKRWEIRAVDEIIAARHKKSLALRASLSEFLTHLANALSMTIERTDIRTRWDREEGTRIGKIHAQERAGSLDYTIDQLILEYHILRQVICDVLEEEAPLSTVEREIIVSAIEQAVNDSATQFSEMLRDIQEGFTHALVHDLRTSMTVAKMSAQLILSRPDDAEHCLSLAGRVVTSMDRLDSMIHDLLDASKLRAGQSLPLEFEDCDIDLMARQVAEELNSTYRGRFVVVGRGPIIGYWSRSGLRRVIENLAINAVKYGDPKTPITITLEPNESTVKFMIHNEGKPISLEDQAILFQPLGRLRSVAGKTGWGLGLTVVRGVTEAHQGTFYLESTKDKGTTFTVELPRNFRKISR